MTNLALFALALTLAAEPPAKASDEATATAPAAAEPGSGDTSAPPSETTPAPVETTPSETEPAGAPVSAAPAPAAPPSETATAAAKPAKDPTADWYSPDYPSRLRILAVPVARTVAKDGIELIIDHRSSAPIYNKESDHPFADMWNSFGGFDQALAVGLELRYGIIDRLDGGVYRVGGSQFDTYEFDARVSALRQEEHEVDLMVRGGLSWFSVPNHADALWPFAQVFASRLFVNRPRYRSGPVPLQLEQCELPG